MKFLIFGIDGGDREIVDIFDMPFLKTVISENREAVLEEDLFERGWAKILTGMRGIDNGAFYMHPKLDGTHAFTTKFSTDQLTGSESSALIWNALEERRATYCVMNVPTTTPVPEGLQHGLVIGSAGGGLNAIDGIPKELVRDDEIRRLLMDRGYVVDIRIPNSQIQKTSELFRLLTKMERIRTECFVEICERRDYALSMLVDRGTTIVQYLARSVIERLRLEGRDAVRRSEDAWVLDLLDEHYRQLDESIRLALTRLQPERFVITADHNTVPHRFRASAEPFLEAHKFLRRKASHGAVGLVKRAIRRMGAEALAKKVASGPLVSETIREINQRFDPKSTIAFGNRYVNGIYINDDRFYGCVSGRKYEASLSKITETFNGLPEEERAGMRAEPYRVDRQGSYSDKLPDIVFSNSEGVHFHETGPSFAYRNESYFRPIPTTLADVTHSAHTGDKGKNPIFIYSESIEGKFDSADLRIVYELALRYLS